LPSSFLLKKRLSVFYSSKEILYLSRDISVKAN
jgi:hypothetical protein